MSAGSGLDELWDVLARLRGPDGCAWDREQTLESLRPFILEEAYELVDAIDGGRPMAIREELGDHLLEFVFATQVGQDAGLFTVEEVLSGIREKLVRRHPHVFENRKAKDAEQALEHWEDIKAQEKPATESVLEGVPRALPALTRANKLSTRAARVGFDWPSLSAVKAKVHEELGELDRAAEQGDADAVREEVGDLLFAVTNLARKLDVDPEMALENANRKFTRRFRHVEDRLKQAGRKPRESNLEEMEALWEEAKKK